MPVFFVGSDSSDHVEEDPYEVELVPQPDETAETTEAPTEETAAEPAE